jgi:hypothetical protein
MGGGLMQLVAYGAQDIYLTGNPQITFFKVVYRRHTNFSMESIKQTFDGRADFGREVSATISRNGDLVHRMYLEHDVLLTCPTGGYHTYMNICSNYGSNLLKEYELEIGGQQIDKHYGHWHSVYSQLTEFNPSGIHKNFVNHKTDVPNDMTQIHADNIPIKSTLFNTMSGNGGAVSTGFHQGTGAEDNIVFGSWNIKGSTVNVPGGATDTARTKIFIPLYFWFCRNPGLALPLIALQYHEVKVKMTFDTLNNLVVEVQEGSGGDDLLGNTGTQIAYRKDIITRSEQKFNLWCDYIYLDTDERRRFAQVSHEYLIEQLQYENFNSSDTLDLNFNHPVKELIWTSSLNEEVGSFSASTINNFIPTTSLTAITTQNQIDILSNRDPGTLSGTFKLKLNGHDRFKARDARYFTRTQVWEHHTGYGGTIRPDNIAVYSFALKPEEHQPSGTCNFSRIDNAQLICENSGSFNVYAVNYNVLRIMSGMGGLAYSN